MTDPSQDKPAEPVDRSTRSTSETPGQAPDSEWQEVDAALSLSDRQPETREPSNTQPSVASRIIDPTSPLIMVETAFLASAASLIWLVNFYFPLGPVLRIFFPIPIALIYLRWNSRAAWMGALVSGLLLSVLMGPVRSIQYVMPFGLMGVLLGMFWRRRARWSLSIGIGALLGSFGVFFRIWFVSLLLGDDLWLYATAQITQLLDWLFVKLGLLIQPSQWLIQVFIVIMILFNNLLYLFVVHLVALFLLDRLGNPIPRPPDWVRVLLDYEEEDRQRS